MQENVNLTDVTVTTPVVENQTVQTEQIVEETIKVTEVAEDVTKKTIEEKVEDKSEVLPKKSIRLEDGTLISNLKITYKNLFDFQNSYDNSKDLMEALVKKQTFDHEVMVQLIYVAYLGTNPTNKMEYFDFIDAIPFDYKRDLNLFQDLTGLKADSKN